MDKKNKKSLYAEFVELTKSFVFAVVLAVIFRSFIYEPFHIPSGSMKPNLLIGDYIFVSKFSYGYSRYSLPFGMPIITGRIFADLPKRGDVVVFKLPYDTSINYIKRIIGFPGDRIQVLNGKLFLNGEEVKRRKVSSFLERQDSGVYRSITRYKEILPNGVSYYILDEDKNGSLDNTEEYIVPDDHYFMMGDNRDNSQDSRVLDAVGYVPEINIVGRAEVIFFSTSSSFWRIWAWFTDFRTERFLQRVMQNNGGD